MKAIVPNVKVVSSFSLVHVNKSWDDKNTFYELFIEKAQCLFLLDYFFMRVNANNEI